MVVSLDGLVNLDIIKPGAKFLCPWNEKTFILQYVTESAAWVQVTEEVEFERKDRKTGEMKLIKQKTTRNEPWSRATRVRML